MAHKYKVSVICAVRDERGTLEKCLNSLVNQSHKPFEILIVDDGSTDGSNEIARSFVKKYSFVKHIQIENKPGSGCVRPRIVAIRKAKGDVLFVVDADAYYSKDYLKLCLKHLNKKGVAGAFGKVRVWDPQTFISRYKDVIYRVRFDDVNRVNQEYSEGKLGTWVLKRSVYDVVGGYDLSKTYSEDTDLSIRVMKRGYSSVYETKALWWHKWEEKFFPTVKNNFKMGRLFFSQGIKSFKSVLKVVYFILPLVFLVGSFFNTWFLILIPLHMLPSFFNGCKLFFKSKGMKNRNYSLLGPLVSYTVNIPYALGFLSKILRP